MTKAKHKRKEATASESLLQPGNLLSGYRPLLILAGACLLVYFPVLSYDFSPMDEQWLILRRKELLGSFSHLPQLFGQSMMDMYYRPLCDSSFLIDYVLGGGSPFLFHLSNVLLHITCALLVFRLFSTLKLSRELSFFAALVFAVHPLTVHAVAWIPGRNDSLLCLFTLLSFLLLIRFARTGKRSFLALHLISFAAALFTKENAIVLPALYFFLWRMERPGETRSRSLQIAGAWVLLAAGWFFLRRSLVDYFPPLAAGSFSSILVRFLSALGYYGGKTILPVGQSVMPVLKDISLLPYLLALLAAVIVTLKFGLRDRKAALFGLAWFWLLILIPAWSGASNHTGEQYEHRIYSSLAGALLFFSQLKIPAKESSLRIAAIALVAGFALKTFFREPVYKDSFSYTIAGTKESPSFAIFHNMLGNLYAARQEHKEAIECFNRAIELNPSRAEFFNNRAFSYTSIKDYAHALEDNTKSIELSKEPADMYANRSMNYFFMNRLAEAKADLDKADSLGCVHILPKYVNDLYLRMNLDSVAFYTQKIREDSTNAENYNVRGIMWLRVRQPKKAYADFCTALEREPGDPAIIANRDAALTQLDPATADSLRRKQR